MKKNELKQVLKPLIKQCIREMLLEENILSGVVSEVVKGIQTQPLVEARTAPSPKREVLTEQLRNEEAEQRAQKIKETRKQMLDAVGQTSYNGVDLFEGTAPLAKAGNPDAQAQAQSPLASVDPNDPGIDISALMGKTGTWKALMGGGK